MSARASKRKLRALALLVVAGAAAYSITSFWLADTGSNLLTIQTVPGASASGSPFDLTTPNPPTPITRPNGNATLQAGVLIGTVTLARGYGARLKADIAWLDPNDAAQVLNTPNAQMYAALYHPIAEGTTCGAVKKSIADPLIDVSSDLGRGTKDYCAHVDENATGSMMNGGNLMLTTSSIAGYIKSSEDDKNATTCPNTVDANNPTDTWCHPSDLSADQNVLWIALTIVTPAGKPAGQQNDLGSLDFYTGLAAV